MVLRGVLRTLPRKLNTPSASLRRSRGASGASPPGKPRIAAAAAGPPGWRFDPGKGAGWGEGGKKCEE